MENLTLTGISGIMVGHATDYANNTGCTAILCNGFTPGVYVPGFAPASHEIELLRAESTVDVVHGLLLCGGSTFGLQAVGGMVSWLQEQNQGLVMPDAVIPLVAGAAIYDLDMNALPGVLPNVQMGYQAASVAVANPVLQGSLGAGTGARCGRIAFCQERSSKSGLGSALIQSGEVKVAALSVVNALGNIYDLQGNWLSGALDFEGKPLLGMELYKTLDGLLPSSNTVLSVIATNVQLNKLQVNRLARMAAPGLARVINPAHLLYDGDIIFALSDKCGIRADENLVGAMAADALSQAIVNAMNISPTIHNLG